MRFNKSLRTPLSIIQSVLPINYNQNEIYLKSYTLMSGT